MRIISTKKKICNICNKILSCIVDKDSCSLDDRLCDRFDERLIELVSDDYKYAIKIDELSMISKQIAINCVLIKEKIKSEKFIFPKNGKNFVNLLLEINHDIFKNTEVNKLGHFRNDGELIKVDNNSHAFEGQFPEKIESLLEGVWEKIFEQIDFHNKVFLEIICAKFLVHFFAIHPFNDGNARTARYFLEILLSQGNFLIDFPSIRRRRRQYMNELRAAHKIRKENSGKICKHSCYILIDLMKKIITPKLLDNNELSDDD